MKNYKVRLGIFIGLVAIFVLPAMDNVQYELVKNLSDDELSSMESQSSTTRKRNNHKEGQELSSKVIASATHDNSMRGVAMSNVISNQSNYYRLVFDENADLSIKYKPVDMQDAQEETCCTMNICCTGALLIGYCLCCAKHNGH